MRFRKYLLQGKGDYYISYSSAYAIEKETNNKSHYDPPAKLLFEGKLYNAPKDYDIILQRVYGKDYMELPPIEKRMNHNPMRLSFNTNGPDEVL